MYLGYTQTVVPPPSNIIGGTPTVNTDRTIGFYNNKGGITKIGFTIFTNSIKKINKPIKHKKK